MQSFREEIIAFNINKSAFTNNFNTLERLIYVYNMVFAI